MGRSGLKLYYGSLVLDLGGDTRIRITGEVTILPEVLGSEVRVRTSGSVARTGSPGTVFRSSESCSG